MSLLSFVAHQFIGLAGVPTAWIANHAHGASDDDTDSRTYCLKNSKTRRKACTAELNEATHIETLPRSLIWMRLKPGVHLLSVQWDGKTRRHRFEGGAGEVKFIEVAGSSTPVNPIYHWSDIDARGAMVRARDAHWLRMSRSGPWCPVEGRCRAILLGPEASAQSLNDQNCAW